MDIKKNVYSWDRTLVFSSALLPGSVRKATVKRKCTFHDFQEISLSPALACSRTLARPASNLHTPFLLYFFHFFLYFSFSLFLFFHHPFYSVYSYHVVGAREADSYVARIVGRALSRSHSCVKKEKGVSATAPLSPSLFFSVSSSFLLFSLSISCILNSSTSRVTLSIRGQGPLVLVSIINDPTSRAVRFLRRIIENIKQIRVGID